MCGITGAIIKQPSSTYWDLLRASDIRGQDGTGIAIKHPSVPIIDSEKVPQRAKEASFLKEHEMQEHDAIIGQNRLAVFGLDEENQQPLIGDRFAIVHNGNLFNYEELFEKYGWYRGYQVDTETILRYLEWTEPFEPDDVKTVLRDMPKFIQGNWACLILDAKTEHIFAVTRCKPLHYVKTQEGTFFFSTERIGRKVFPEEQIKALDEQAEVMAFKII